MTRSISRITGLIVMIAVSAMLGWSAEEQQKDKTASEAQRDCDWRTPSIFDSVID